MFLDAKRTLSKKPDQKTPAIFYDISPGAHKFSLFKVGFADTTLSIDIKKFEKNNFNINLKKLTDDKMEGVGDYGQAKIMAEEICKEPLAA